MAVASLPPFETPTPLNLDQVRVDPAWALRIPSDFAQRRAVLPLSKVEGQVVVACAKQLDASTQKALSNYLGVEFTTRTAEPESLRRSIARVYQPTVFDSHANSTVTYPRELNSPYLPMMRFKCAMRYCKRPCCAVHRIFTWCPLLIIWLCNCESMVSWKLFAH